MSSPAVISIWIISVASYRRPAEFPRADSFIFLPRDGAVRVCLHPGEPASTTEAKE